MKRIFAIALAIVLVFAFTVSVAAKSSPTGKQYYKITISVEGSGTARSSANKIIKASGDTVILTAEELDGYFTRWIITGDYDAVDGTISEKVFTIRPKSDIYAIANFSIDANVLHITGQAVGGGSVIISHEVVGKGTDTIVTLTAVDGEEKFVEWEIKSDYKIVEGTLKTRVLKIIPYTDIVATARFNGAAKPGKPDDSDTSPRTGDPLYVVIPFMAIALAGLFISMKKLRKDS